MLAPLTSMSPSRFLGAKECPLREALSANRVDAALPYGPAARLGSAIHSLLEAAGAGEFAPGDAEAIDRKWDELVTAAERSMASRWLERHMVPLKESVADFEVRRLQARERALELAAASEAAGVAAPHAQDQFGCELPVASPDGTVRGQIDAVGRSEDGPVVRDYKSGAIFEPRARGEAILKPAYQTQLKLYAVLYALTTGEWPARLEIVPVLGEAQEVPFTRESCIALLEEARHTLAAINRALGSGASPEETQRALARPSPKVCGYCAYRPICAPYKRECEDKGPHHEARDVLGKFNSLKELGNGRLLMEIRTGDDTVRIRGLMPGDRHPALARLQPGDRIGVFNLRGTGAASTFAESAYTVVYRFTSAAREQRPPGAPQQP